MLGVLEHTLYPFLSTAHVILITRFYWPTTGALMHRRKSNTAMSLLAETTKFPSCDCASSFFGLLLAVAHTAHSTLGGSLCRDVPSPTLARTPLTLARSPPSPPPAFLAAPLPPPATTSFARYRDSSPQVAALESIPHARTMALLPSIVLEHNRALPDCSDFGR